jgi:Uma2 family endonuclease
MGMPDVARWTREQVLALPEDGKKYELIDGELIVTPTPRVRHQEGVMELYLLLHPFVTARGIGRCFCVPGDLEIEPGQVNEPDLFVVPPGPRYSRWEDFPVPLLVIEVASPSTARYDRGLKRRFYQRAGVPEYWIVDLDARVVERWRPGDERPEVLDRELTWRPGEDGGDVVPEAALVLDLAGFFSQVMEHE